jgi:hypothetical protein
MKPDLVLVRAVEPMSPRQRLEKIQSTLGMIDSSELLAALPECVHARDNHLIAVDLLAEMRIELHLLGEQLAELLSPTGLVGRNILRRERSGT